MQLSDKEIAQFQRYILRYHRAWGRHELPWRVNTDPYAVLVSEIMLQQTQVERVIPKFLAFMAAFPNFESLASVSVGQLMQLWQGLGYNRRGLNLQRASQQVVEQYGGQLPSETELLVALPGIGGYTAGALRAFAFNLPATVIETNIRAVYLFHFFHNSYTVDDKQLAPLIEVTMDQTNPRIWYWALMDYGSHLKRNVGNATKQSKHYVKQSSFKGSHRQLRGQILKLIITHTTYSYRQLVKELNTSPEKIQQVIDELVAEGFILAEADQLSLPTNPASYGTISP